MRGPGSIEIGPRNLAGPLLTWASVHWDVGISAEIPVDLRLDTGASRSRIDVSALRIPRLELHTGASETVIQLPTAGQTWVRVDCGFAAVNVAVPQRVAARISGKVGLGSLLVDEARFPRFGEGWAWADFETAIDTGWMSPSPADLVGSGIWPGPTLRSPAAGRRVGLVPHTGFEPVISALRGRCPGPLDECGGGVPKGRREYSNGGMTDP